MKNTDLKKEILDLRELVKLKDEEIIRQINKRKAYCAAYNWVILITFVVILIHLFL